MIIKSKSLSKRRLHPCFNLKLPLGLFAIITLLIYIPSKVTVGLAVIAIVLSLEVISRRSQIEIKDDRLVISNGVVGFEIFRKDLKGCSIRRNYLFGHRLKLQGRCHVTTGHFLKSERSYLVLRDQYTISLSQLEYLLDNWAGEASAKSKQPS